eukprot:98634-Chlamydomonas_euryale.AAC.1
MSTQYVKLCTRRGVRAAPGERSRSGCVAMAVARRRSSPSRTTSAAPAKAVAGEKAFAAVSCTFTGVQVQAVRRVAVRQGAEGRGWWAAPFPAALADVSGGVL